MCYTRQACNNHAKRRTVGMSYKGRTTVVGGRGQIFFIVMGGCEIIKVCEHV